MNPADIPPVTTATSALPPQARPLHIRFGLRGLLAFIAFASVLFAASNAIGVVWSFSIILVSLLIAGHLFGAVVGTRLRDHATEMVHRGGPEMDSLRRGASPLGASGFGQQAISPNPSPGGLIERRSLGRLPAVLTVLGAIAGGSLAIVAMHYYFADFRWGDRVIAIGSFAVLGGLTAFALGTFVQVGLWPAVRYYFCRGARQRLNESGSVRIQARRASEWVGARTRGEVPRDADAG